MWSHQSSPAAHRKNLLHHLLKFTEYSNHQKLFSFKFVFVKNFFSSKILSVQNLFDQIFRLVRSKRALPFCAGDFSLYFKQNLLLHKLPIKFIYKKAVAFELSLFWHHPSPRSWFQGLFIIFLHSKS